MANTSAMRPQTVRSLKGVVDPPASPRRPARVNDASDTTGKARAKAAPTRKSRATRMPTAPPCSILLESPRAPPKLTAQDCNPTGNIRMSPRTIVATLMTLEPELEVAVLVLEDLRVPGPQDEPVSIGRDGEYGLS